MTGELTSQVLYAHWWGSTIATRRRATDEEMHAWVALSMRWPPGTRVTVTPERGGAWRGMIEDWTPPGSGRLMAVVKPDPDNPGWLGSAAAVHVLPAFLGPILVPLR